VYYYENVLRAPAVSLRSRPTRVSSRPPSPSQMSSSLSSFHRNKWTKTSRPKRPTSSQCPRPRPLAQPGCAAGTAWQETDGNTSPSPGKASGKPKTAPAPAPPGKGRRGGAGGARWIKLLALDLVCLVAAARVPRWAGQQTRSIQAGGRGRMQDAAGTKNGKSDWYIPRYTKLNTVYLELYLDKRRSIPRYTQLYPVIPSYPELYRSELYRV